LVNPLEGYWSVSGTWAWPIFNGFTLNWQDGFWAGNLKQNEGAPKNCRCGFKGSP